jgi:beta-lactam-binding protein with PASTA domain
LKIAKITNAPAMGTATGSVIGHTPPRGHRVDTDTMIEVQIAQ